ncbi:tRNA (adenine(22)-N(1))-methyltransferase [Gracilibacillus alcaliphilus]|uniref:tRNA (adenine(22)-N(1))-methyltransferase n=1 Tax=Gracilibacillus alcaliphilus TaxID=1401441 RepID=UPI00195AF531|nr:class I SAM-dependent methyltransferase [Gracilibacillus alcaliphilus]MBM7675002.1 tRNA (adenine22-N1)-methyltransferase [Gracilibacillus alcaliphilus]
MISKRLRLIASFLKEPIVFADIGSDHAYLPCLVCSADPTATAIAGEVNHGPFLRAQQTVHEQGLSRQIEVRKGNGLAVIEAGEVNQITIAGMGGKLITAILEEGQDKLIGVDRLILQPNLDAHIVREWLMSDQYQVTSEAIIEEDGYIYEIIAADKVAESVALSEKELLFGPQLVRDKTTTFIKKWRGEHTKRTRLINQMKQAVHPPQDKIEQVEHERTLIEEVLAE